MNNKTHFFFVSRQRNAYCVSVIVIFGWLRLCEAEHFLNSFLAYSMWSPVMGWIPLKSLSSAFSMRRKRKMVLWSIHCYWINCIRMRREKEADGSSSWKMSVSLNFHFHSEDEESCEINGREMMRRYAFAVLAIFGTVMTIGFITTSDSNSLYLLQRCQSLASQQQSLSSLIVETTPFSKLIARVFHEKKRLFVTHAFNHLKWPFYSFSMQRWNSNTKETKTAHQNLITIRACVVA